MKYNIILLFLITAFFSCNNKRTNLIRYDNDLIHYSRRVEFNKTDSSAVLYWVGNSISAKFTGTEVKVLIKNRNDKNYFNVILDDSIFIFHPKSAKKWYKLASGLKDTVHNVEIFRRMVASPTYFYAFEINPKGKFLKVSQKKRKIEFYGNSITEGASINDYSNTEPEKWDSLYTDNYYSYGAITARYFDAEYTCIARGGIGLMVSWYPMIMPEMWDRLNPDDSLSKWDFSKYSPDIVVINLFQNDAALVNRPEHPQFKARFGNTPPDSSFIVKAYSNFLTKIRKVYPKSYIICTLGCMTATRKDLPWRGYVKSAVKKMNDDKIFHYFFFYKGGYMHPKVEEHKRMADSLINFINNNINW